MKEEVGPQSWFWFGVRVGGVGGTLSWSWRGGGPSREDWRGQGADPGSCSGQDTATRPPWWTDGQTENVTFRRTSYLVKI